MRRLFFVGFLFLIFGLFGCGISINDDDKVSGEPKFTIETMLVDDFKVSIYAEKELTIYATITYTGEEAEKDIYHGGSIFFFNIYQEDGDFEYLGGMDQPLLTTTLIRNEPHRVDFIGIERLNLKNGTYEFEAIADFSLDSDDVVGTNIEIPVSKMKEIE